MNPIPMSVFATLAGLSLASLALVVRDKTNDSSSIIEEKIKYSELKGIRKALSYVFIGFIFSIIGLILTAIMQNIALFQIFSLNARNIIGTLDNVFSFICLFIASSYLFGGASYLVVNRLQTNGTVILYLFNKIKLGWVIKSYNWFLDLFARIILGGFFPNN